MQYFEVCSKRLVYMPTELYFLFFYFYDLACLLVRATCVCVCIYVCILSFSFVRLATNTEYVLLCHMIPLESSTRHVSYSPATCSSTHPYDNKKKQVRYERQKTAPEEFGRRGVRYLRKQVGLLQKTTIGCYRTVCSTSSNHSCRV